MVDNVARGNSALDGYKARLAIAVGLWRARALPARPTQDDFSKSVVENGGRGVSQNSVSRWLAGILPKDLETLTAIPLALGVDPGWLLFGHLSEAPAPSLTGDHGKPVPDIRNAFLPAAEAARKLSPARRKRRGGSK